jgi:hypothetical protein
MECVIRKRICNYCLSVKIYSQVPFNNEQKAVISITIHIIAL